MARRFKAKKRRTLKTKLLWFLFICLMLFVILAAVFKNFKLATTNEEFIKNLLEDSNYHLKYNKTASRFITNISNFLSSFKINEPITILEESLGYTFTSSNKPVENKNEIKMVFHKNDVDDLILPKASRVYIYSTHYKEGYSANNLEDYNITPNVKMASMLLKEN